MAFVNGGQVNDSIDVEVLPAVIDPAARPAFKLSEIPSDQFAAQIVTTLLTAKGGLAKYDEIVTDAIQMLRRDFTSELDALREQCGRMAQELSRAGEARDKALRQAAEESARRESAERRAETLRADAEAWRARNTPEVTDFLSAVQRAAVNQRAAADQRDHRPGTQRAGQTPEDWLWNIASLATSAAHAAPSARPNDRTEYQQLIVACAAACLHWHASAKRTG
jgi:hypothetical protein